MSTSVLVHSANCDVKLSTEQPTLLKTWVEARALFERHLTPVNHTPKGWPVYSQDDIDALVERLNIHLPEQF